MASVSALDPVKLAVVWVRKAKGGSLQWVDECTEDQFYYYVLAKRLKLLGHLAKYGLVVLTIFDEPSKCRGTPENCAALDPQVYNIHFPVLAPWISLIIAIALYCIIFFRMTLRRWAMGEAYDFHSWHRFTAVVTSLGMASSVVAFFWPPMLLISLICRPLVFLGVSKSLRTGAVEIVKSIPGFADVLVSFFICVAIFVWMGMVLFPGTQEGAIDFYSWGDGFAKLWTGYTTANSPNFYIPAMNQNRCYFIFFFTYMLLTLFLLSNVLLAKVYDAYKDSLKEKYTTLRDNQIQSMMRGFGKLADPATNKISVETWNKFFLEYCDPYMGGITVGNINDPEYNLFRGGVILKLFYGIDVEKMGGLDINEWKKVLGIFFDRDIYIPTRRPPRAGTTQLEAFFTSGTDILAFNVVWDKVMDAVITVGTFITFLLSHSFAASPTTPNLMHSGIFWFLFSFSIFYFVGLNTKMTTLGFERFWHKKVTQHRFDFLNVYGLMIVELLYIGVWQTDGMARAVILLHMARALRLFVYIGPLQKLFVIIKQLIPTFWQVLMILLVVYYIFAVIGQWAFGGLIYTTNPALANTNFSQGLYWSLTFNDVVSGMVTLFLVMLVNNWYMVADGYMLTSGSIWCGIFFFAWYVVANFIMINIVIAVILDGTGIVSAQLAKAEEESKSHKRITSAELIQSASGDHSAAFMMRQILEEEDDVFATTKKAAGDDDSSDGAASDGGRRRGSPSKRASVG